MKFYQYKSDSDVREEWYYIFTIFHPNGLVRERNPISGNSENFRYDEEEYDDEDDCLIRSYNSHFIYEGE